MNLYNYLKFVLRLDQLLENTPGIVIKSKNEIIYSMNNEIVTTIFQYILARHLLKSLYIHFE